MIMRRPQQIPNRIAVKWAGTKEEGKDLYVSWGDGAFKADARFTLDAISTMAKELTRRGYDITTLRFEIRKTPASATASIDLQPANPFTQPW